MDTLSDRPAHKGYPGYVYSQSLIDWIKDEMMKTYREIYKQEFEKFLKGKYLDG